jgi:hypothetical protein
MILGFNGQRVWCRTTEEKILLAMENDYKSHKKISIRDTVIVRADLSKEYILWNTSLVRTSWKDDVSIYIASNMEERDRYWKPNPYNMWQPRDYIISNTTKSRLNAFLDYYGFNSLEVHSSKKDWSVKHNGKELELDCWYKLDFNTKELVKE